MRRVMLILVLLLLLAIAAPLAAQDEAKIGIAQSNVRLRAEASTNSAQLGNLNTGDRIIILEEVTGQELNIGGTTSDLWYRIQHDDETDAYVWAGLVELDENALLLMRAEPGQAIELALPNGLQIDLPDGALYEYDGASIELLYEDAPRDSEPGTFEFLGEPFRFDVSNDNLFAEVVTLQIPYDPSLLPDDVPQANLFAAILVDGGWRRILSDVDEGNSIIVAQTLHNGFWAWAYDTQPNLSDESRQFYTDASTQPDAIMNAEDAVSARLTEWAERWDSCGAIVENLEDAQDIQEQARNIVNQFGIETAILPTGGWDDFGGKAATITIGDTIVVLYYGALLDGLYIGRVAEDNTEDVRCLVSALVANYRLVEAQAVLQALQHPQQTSFHPIYAEALERFAAIQSDAIDWSATAHPDEEIDEIMALLEVSEDMASQPREPVEIVPEFYAKFECVEGCDRADDFEIIMNAGGNALRLIRGDRETDVELAEGDWNGYIIPVDGRNFPIDERVTTSGNTRNVVTAHEVVFEGMEVIPVAGQSVEALHYTQERELQYATGNGPVNDGNIFHTEMYFDAASGILLFTKLTFTPGPEGTSFPDSAHMLAETNQPLATVEN